MNHRKSEHPSRKVCRYFKDDCCQFTAKDCWYRHEDKTSQSDVDVDFENTCKDCEKVFGTRSELMKHKKDRHMEKISKCRDFKLGKCPWNSNNCWFLHEEVNMDDVNMDVDIEEQVFCEDQKKQPPDQMVLMMEMINKLMTQMEMLQKRTI